MVRKNGKIRSEALLNMLEDLEKEKRRTIKTKAKFEALFEQSPDGIIIYDVKKHKILDFNKASYKNLGYSRKEFEKINLHDIEVVENKKEIKRHIKEQVKKGGAVFETKHKKKNGRIIDVLVTSKLIKIGKEKRGMAIFRDITEQKEIERKLKEGEEKFRTLFEFSQEGIVLLDPKTLRYGTVNPAAVKMFGFKTEKRFNF